MWKLYDRQAVVGGIAGLLAGLTHAGLLASLHGFQAVASLGGLSNRWIIGFLYHLILSVCAGIVYSTLFRPPFKSPVESLMSGMVYGLLLWVILTLNLFPILYGTGPLWQVEAVEDTVPALFGYFFQGAVLGIIYYILSSVIVHSKEISEEPAVTRPPPIAQHRIIILGGGFAGTTTARHLERIFRRDERADITLISDTNYLLFTPMLAEVTASGIEARHISTPLRAFLRRTRVIHGEALYIDLKKRGVRLAPSGAGVNTPLDVPFDHLVLALGTVPHFFGLQDIEAQAFTFKSLEEAIRLRNHVIEMLERADSEKDPQQRKAQLTFVIAGGGFAGAELIGGLNDFVRGSLWYYPNIPIEEVSLILVHSKDRILPELSDELAEYARERMANRGVSFRLGFRVAGASAGKVALSNGETIATQTLVWAAGNRPHPLIHDTGLEVDDRGYVKTDITMSIPNLSNIWAIGDCAAIPDSYTGGFCPPTAQHALREAAALARNIHASIQGRRLKPFVYRALGSLVVLGHQTACAEICGVKFSGLLAWWMWRTVYLAKLPSFEKKIRVALDWSIDLFFPRDIAQTATYHYTARAVDGEGPDEGNNA